MHFRSYSNNTATWYNLGQKFSEMFAYAIFLVIFIGISHATLLKFESTNEKHVNFHVILYTW